NALVLAFFRGYGGVAHPYFWNILRATSVRLSKQEEQQGNKQKKESPASFPVIATAVLPSIISSSSGCSSSQHGNSVCSLAASLSHRSGPPPWRENEERN
ncbi:hypothetical protein ATANTOWER_024093, partial [Ataeniobius toweri]|nr:hypothetical protein [Ataeniobius toweri]